MQELAQKFSDYKVPSDLKRSFGSNNFIKMMLFANEVQLNNDAIDYYMACPPYRMEEESYEDMKARTKFSNALLKYRSKLYDYSVYEEQK